MLKLIVRACVLIIVFVSNSMAQGPEKVVNEKLFGKDCYYLPEMPATSVIKGVLVLVPGFGEHPYSVTAQTSIVQEALKKDIAVIMPALSPKSDKFSITEAATNRLGQMIIHFYAVNKLKATVPLYLGGFSIGGTTVIAYYTHQQKNQGKAFPIPKKIFAIDPPLDMNRMYQSFSRLGEQLLIKEIESLNNTNSIYTPGMDFKQLPDYKTTALRLYAEPDILWWIKNRGLDYSDINVVDEAGYVNRLLKKDKENQVELILTNDRGYRYGGQRHPHAWSLAEPVELISWLTL
ncbi:hypothetical protein [Pedobacter gandavensis]|uniref:hypothetical protein n=1 Tax=Pedobacter gandavensis TaxID=2679963 RepID=UPI002930D344|nr:hypothetical protein [Pedobacter gandavensis]